MGLKRVVIAVDGSKESISAAQAVRPRPHRRCRDGDRERETARAATSERESGERETARAATGERESGELETARWWRRRVWRLARRRWRGRESQSRWFGERDRERGVSVRR
ncbi:hypothetical protein Syun_014871 [Stephania yunnanensis]|uniref:Universal stress protein n=1 Tax=Stephania yunnanensis TaxID=152371 RepID=A0AAP0JL79_9MAGN